MKTVLVTGGAGFIGSHLVDRLINKFRIVVIDNLSTGRKSNLPRGIIFHQLDIRSPKVSAIFRRYRPHYLCHLAAQKSVNYSVRDPLHDAEQNIIGSLNVLEVAARHHVRRVLFTSTGGAIYGDNSIIPTPETAAVRPTSPYAIAKLATEHYLDFYRATKGISTLSLRLANVYGPRQDPDGEAGVIAIYMKRKMSGRPLIVTGTGRQTRDFVYVGDVIEAITKAMSKEATGVINIGTGKQTSIFDLARTVRSMPGKQTRIVTVPSRPAEVKYSALANRRAARVLNWKPRTDLASGLRRTYQWLKSEHE